MVKTIITFLLLGMLGPVAESQTIRVRDGYGDKLYFVDGQTIREKDSYGTSLYYVDGQTLRRKDSYGDKVWFFELLPEKWMIVCLIKP